MAGRRLNHVFLNLIDNAVRAAEPYCRVFAHRRRDEPSFSSRDSGPVIPIENHEEISRLYTTRQAGEGTGLGLALARQVTLQHGGTIKVGRSALGGALLTVSLPLNNTRPAVVGPSDPAAMMH